MNHIMLDLETMGTGPNAAIVAIGAVEFELTQTGGQLGDSFYQCISLESAMAGGGQVDASTVLWWLNQSDAARARHPTHRHPPQRQRRRHQPGQPPDCHIGTGHRLTTT